MSNRTVRLAFSLFVVLIISTNDSRAENYDLIPIPEFYKQPLLNGMEIVFLSGGEDRVPFVLMIKNGAAFDPVNKWGLSYLTTWLMFEEIQVSDGLTIREEIEKLGAKLDFRVEWDAIYLFGDAGRERMVEVLNLLAELVVHPVFLQETFDRLILQLEEQVEQESQQVQVRTQKLLNAQLFQAHPYGHPIKGVPRTIRNQTLRDVRVHYRKLFLPNQAQLALYDSGGRDELFEALSRQWGNWVRSRPLPFTFRKAIPLSGRQIHLMEAAASSAMFRLGKLAVSRDSADYYALKVLEQYLMLSLPDWAGEVEQREQIHASTEVQGRLMPGLLQLSIQAPPQQLLAYFDKFETLIEELEQGLIDSPRFEEAKRLVYQDQTYSMQEPVPRLYQLLETNLFNVGVNFINYYGYRLNRVTPEVFQRAVQEYLSLEDFVLVVAGPGDQLKPELEKIGTVTVAP
ncbi:MAG: insulinase family protein [Acidobacteriota bacterium]